MKLQRTGFNNFSWLEAWVIFFGGMVGGPGSGGTGELSGQGGGSEVENCFSEGRRCVELKRLLR